MSIEAKPILGQDTIFGRLYYQDSDYAALHAETEALRAENEQLRDSTKRIDAYWQAELRDCRNERDGLTAARIAYASEFAPDEHGNPDVGSVHSNIRALKAERDRINADRKACWEEFKALVKSSCEKERYLQEEIEQLRALLTAQQQASAAQNQCGGCGFPNGAKPHCGYHGNTQSAPAGAVTMQQVLIAYDYATDHPHKYLRGTTNWCAAFAHSLNEQLDAAPAKPAAQDKGEIRALKMGV